MMKLLPSVLISVLLVSCALGPKQASSEIDDTPVKINKSAIPVSPSESSSIDGEANITSEPEIKPTGKLGFRTPDLVKSLPTESQSSGSAPQTEEIDDEVNSSTTIQVGAQ